MDRTKLISQLVKHEGLRLKPYTDTVGKLTIGIGHNLTDNGLTKDQCVAICNDDIDNTVALLESKCPWFKGLDDVRQRAIADMTFNLMEKILDFTGLIAAINVKAWDAAANHILNSKFGQQVGKRAQDLAHMMRTGTDPIL